MMIPETLPVRGAPRSIQAQPPRKRTVTVFATFVLITVCILTGAPAATAAAAPTVTLPGCAGDSSGPCAGGMYIRFASDSPALACGGACPGVCPCPSELKDGSTTISEA